MLTCNLYLLEISVGEIICRLIYVYEIILNHKNFNCVTWVNVILLSCVSLPYYAIVNTAQDIDPPLSVSIAIPGPVL